MRICIYIDEDLWERFKAKVRSGNTSGVIRDLIKGYLSGSRSLDTATLTSFLEDAVFINEENVFNADLMTLYKFIKYFRDIAPQIISSSKLRKLFAITPPLVLRGSIDDIWEIELEYNRVIIKFKWLNVEEALIEYILHIQGSTSVPPFINTPVIIDLMRETCEFNVFQKPHLFINGVNKWYGLKANYTGKTLLDFPRELPTCSLKDTECIETLLQILRAVFNKYCRKKEVEVLHDFLKELYTKHLQQGS